MAGDFVMIQHATPRKPEVLRLATLLDIEPAHAFGLCVMAWMWFDEQTENGRAFGATEEMLDRVLCRAGFCHALREVGWLQVREGSLEVPNFDRLMGESAKKRAKNTLRQQKLRRAPVTDLSRIPRDKSATKEEKRREEKNSNTPLPHLPEILQGERFRETLNSWLAYKRKPYKPQGLQALVSRAEKLAIVHGVDAVADAMQRAMANGWQGWDQESSFANGQSAKPTQKVIRLGDDPE